MCRALPPDVLNKLAFGTSEVIAKCDDDFQTPIMASFDAQLPPTWARAYFPIICWLQDNIPPSIGARFSSDIRGIKSFVDHAAIGIHNFRTGEKANQTAILKSLDDLPDKYLMSSSLALIAGGSDTTGFTFSYACWQLVQNPVLAARLREEVDALFEQAAPGYPSLTAMEASPLLYGFVKESLRCALAIPGRLPRIVPGDGRAPLVVDGKEIPSGSVVGMSAYTMHRDPEIWGPDVLEFNPDRWIGQPSRAKAADIVIFSKGIRNCAGQPLASAELHMGLAFLSRRYDMRLVAGPREWSSMDYFVTTGPHFYVKLTPREGVPIPSIS